MSTAEEEYWKSVARMDKSMEGAGIAFLVLVGLLSILAIIRVTVP